MSSSDVIKAYDPNNVMCGTAYQIQNGIYGIHVRGDDPSTPGTDEGAVNGDAITFKINGETASVVNGSNIWSYPGPAILCDIDVPSAPPIADAGGPYSGQEGQVITFDGSGSLYVGTYSWNFGDGNTGSGVSPTHTYLDEGSGSYTVTLTVTNGAGSDVETTTANISNAVPVVEAGNNQSASEGSTLSFSGSATDAGVNDVLSYNWTFGDGGSASGQNTNHYYADNGVFTTTLAVNDGDGGTGTDNLTVTISNVPPAVDAGGDKTVDEGSVVYFNALVTDPGTSDIHIYSWNFGDGGTGSGQNTNHTYADEGVFTVNLTVNDGDDNGYDNLTATVNNVAPTANSGGPYSAVINQSIQFNGSATDPGTNDVLTYQWDLDNDGQYDDYTGRYPSRTYTTPGEYPISLRVTDDDGGSDTDDTIVTVSEGVAVTITTSPIEGLSIIVDGETLPSPVTVKKMPGSTISVTALWDHYPGDGIRYHYQNWSDGGARSHSITVPAGPVTITANYGLQYRVDIDTGDKGGNPQGIGWYYPGTQVTISVDSLVLGTQGSTRYRFQNWSGEGIGSYSGSNNPATVTVNEWIIQTVSWEPEYLLQLLTTHGSASGGGWYTDGQQVPISIDALVDEGNGERYRFLSWNGEGTGSYTGSDNPALVTMYGPVVETVVWQAQYYLDLVTEYGEPTGEDWYDEGQRVTVSIDTTVEAETGTRVRFLSWQGIGNGSYTGENFTFQVTMNNPITETAQWQTQYYLTLVSEDDRGNPEGEGWYDAGNLVTFTIDSTEAESDVIRHRFVGWEGSGAGSYTGEERSPSIVLIGPVEEVAVWKTQYYISLGINPPDGGTVIPFSEPGGWSNAFETLELTAIGDADSGYGFSHWSSGGDTVTTANPYAFIVNEPLHLDATFKKGKFIITSVPTGLVLTVDGLEIISPMVYNWPTGSSHTIGALSPQGDDITSHYEFGSWSDFGAQEHDILLEDTAATYTAYFDASFYLSVEPDSGNPVGEGWYAEGTDVLVSADSLLDGYGGLRYKFAEWIGTGQGSVSSTDREIHVILQGPVTEQSQWTPQFKLSVQTIPIYAPGASIQIDPPGPWYDPNTQVRLQVSITDPSYSFLGWNGDVLTSANPLTIHITEPMDIIAKFDTPNFPPRIVGIPEISMLEDEIFSRSYTWLSQYVTDANDPIEWLSFTFGGQTHLTFEMDSAQQEFNIIPESNWHGSEKIGLKVQDPFGLADSDSFNVNVISVNDPPGSFELISPPQDTSISEWFWPMEFHWEHSANVDTGDTIIYNFYVSPSSNLSGPGTIAVSIGDTAIMMNLQPEGIYYWGVWAEDALREKTLCNEIFRITVFQTDVETEDQKMPTEYSLFQNFPNPFNPYTTIRYGLPKADETELLIFDIQGRMVRRLFEGRMPAGYHEIRWDGRDNYGRQASSGMYLLIIKAGKFIEQRKMVLLR